MAKRFKVEPLQPKTKRPSYARDKFATWPTNSEIVRQFIRAFGVAAPRRNRHELVAIVDRFLDATAEMPLKPCEVINEPIAFLKLKPRTVNGFEAEGVRTVADLADLSRDDILAIANFGDSTVAEVRAALDKHGLALRENP